MILKGTYLCRRGLQERRVDEAQKHIQVKGKLGATPAQDHGGRSLHVKRPGQPQGLRESNAKEGTQATGGLIRATNTVGRLVVGIRGLIIHTYLHFS